MSCPVVAVVVATRGRAAEVRVLLEWLARSTRRPDCVVIVGSDPTDWAGANGGPLAPVTLVSPGPGLTRQRNQGMRHLLGQARRPDLVFFFDDDFRPDRRWIEEATAVFVAMPDVTGLTGEVLGDGARAAAIGEAIAQEIVDGWMPPQNSQARPVSRLYGCNMAVRMGVFPCARFDERLPLYGWLEDLDFSGQLAGRLVVAQACGGVHLGSKNARVSGRRYGYSQIVNPLYLARKGTCPKGFALQLVMRALLSNALRSVRQHPLFDYRGRLAGNLRALVDMARNRAAPERILEL